MNVPAAPPAELSSQSALRITLVFSDGDVVGFDEFMRQALYHPEFGFYGSGESRVGARTGGDFFTNVTVGAVYGEILAGQVREVWQQVGRPAEFVLFEQGANDGQLLADMLAVLQKEPELGAALRPIVLEPNPKLQERQKETLAPYSAAVKWVPDWNSVAPCDCGMFVANELLDAFPFALAQWDGKRWRERAVLIRANGGAEWIWREPAGWLRARLEEFPRPPHAPFLLEIPRDLPDWVAWLTAKIRRGLVLLCDYGFTEDELFSQVRPEGTYRCYSKHRRETNPLDGFGDRDITADVNFSGLARLFSAAGWNILGIPDQHHFLVGAAQEWMQAIEREGLTPVTQRKLRQLRMLLHPETMGTRFRFFVAAHRLPQSVSLSGLRHVRTH